MQNSNTNELKKFLEGIKFSSQNNKNFLSEESNDDDLLDPIETIVIRNKHDKGAENNIFDNEYGYSSDEEINQFSPEQITQILGSKDIEDSFAQQYNVIVDYLKEKSRKDEDRNVIYNDFIIRKDKDRAIIFYLKNVEYKHIKDRFFSIKNTLIEEEVKDYICFSQIEIPGHVSVVSFNVENRVIKESRIFTTYFVSLEEIEIMQKIASDILKLQFLEKEDLKNLKQEYGKLDKEKKIEFMNSALLKIKNPNIKKSLLLFKEFKERNLNREGACSLATMSFLRNIEKISRKQGLENVINFLNQNNNNKEIESCYGEDFLNGFNSVKCLDYNANEAMIWFLGRNKGFSYDEFNSFIKQNHVYNNKLLKFSFEDETLEKKFSSFLRAFIEDSYQANKKFDINNELFHFLNKIEYFKNLPKDKQKKLCIQIIQSLPSEEDVEEYKNRFFKEKNYKELQKVLNENRKQRKNIEYKHLEDESEDSKEESIQKGLDIFENISKNMDLKNSKEAFEEIKEYSSLKKQDLIKKKSKKVENAVRKVVFNNLQSAFKEIKDLSEAKKEYSLEEIVEEKSQKNSSKIEEEPSLVENSEYINSPKLNPNEIKIEVPKIEVPFSGIEEPTSKIDLNPHSNQNNDTIQEEYNKKEEKVNKFICPCECRIM